jgi:diphthamide synthase (EF-2-diphthine--ammonia ligase)
LGVVGCVVRRVAVGWSGGKDSTLALYRAVRELGLSNPILVTTYSEEFRRVSMHGVRLELLREQARCLGLELLEVALPSPCSDALWGLDTKVLAHRFTELGFKAVVVCVDTAQAPSWLVGHEFSDELLENLPPSVDPCGERGEFHTFVYDGPLFTQPVRFTRGETVLRDNRFLYIDLEPV